MESIAPYLPTRIDYTWVKGRVLSLLKQLCSRYAAELAAKFAVLVIMALPLAAAPIFFIAAVTAMADLPMLYKPTEGITNA